MKIAIIGTGNVGGALATRWAAAGHTILLGVRDPESFKGKQLLSNSNTSVHTVDAAAQLAEVILLATPAPVTVSVVQQLGDTTGKIIIDAMNIVGGRGPEGYSNTTAAILDHTATDAVVKCFNTTGSENMADPVYGDTAIDLFVCGDHARAKEIAQQLATDAGFANCYDVGGNAQFDLQEQFARFWINLAIFQGMGRQIGFKLLKRD